MGFYVMMQDGCTSVCWEEGGHGAQVSAGNAGDGFSSLGE